MKRVWTAGKPKKKPDYESEQITEDMLKSVVAAYSIRNGIDLGRDSHSIDYGKICNN